MSGFAIRYPFFIIMLCLIDRGASASVTVARMPVDLFPADQYSGRRRGDVLLRHAARADRDRHHRSASSASLLWAAASTTSNRARCPASA